jgi:CO dehydrogenase maturation factor
VNNLLRRYLSLLEQNYRYVLMDNAAGMEHLSRLTSDHVDLLLLVSEPTFTGLTTVQRIHELSGRLPIKIGRRALVINKVGPPGLSRKAAEVADALTVDERIQIPFNESLAALSQSDDGLTPAAADVVTGATGGLLALCRAPTGRAPAVCR